MSIAEIRSYTKPQPTVQEVMKATLLILGEQEEDLKVKDFNELDIVLATISIQWDTVQWIRTIYIIKVCHFHFVICITVQMFRRIPTIETVNVS